MAEVMDVDYRVTDCRQHIPHDVVVDNLGRAAREQLSQGKSLRWKLVRQQAFKWSNGRSELMGLFVNASIESRCIDGHVVHMVEVDVDMDLRPEPRPSLYGSL